MAKDECGAIERFLDGQVTCWNAGDKDGFFEQYRAMAPRGLTIEYVGQPPRDGWPVLEEMWAQQNHKIEIAIVSSIVKGNEAACHHLNKVANTGVAIPTIEFYEAVDGVLRVRYFVGR